MNWIYNITKENSKKKKKRHVLVSTLVGLRLGNTGYTRGSLNNEVNMMRMAKWLPNEL
jgi:hypothetical protein